MDCDQRIGGDLQMPPVRVVCGASALGRYHRRPQGMLGRTKCTEGRAIMRLANAAQDLATDTNFRFKRGDPRYLESVFRVLPGKLIAQMKAAQGNVANATPLAVADFKDAVDDRLRRLVSIRPENAGILVFDHGAVFF